MDAATQRRIMEQVEAARRANPFYLSPANTNFAEAFQRIERLERMIAIVVRELQSHEDPECPDTDLRNIERTLEAEEIDRMKG